MRKTILFLVIAILSSCSVINKHRQLRKSDQKTTIETAVTTVVNEKIDTVITLRPDSVAIERPLTELLEKGVIEATDGAQSVTVSYDKKTGQIRAAGKTSSQRIPVIFERQTVTSAHTSVNQERKTDEVISDKQSIAPRWIFWVLIITSLLAGFYVFWLKKRSGSV